MTPETGPSQLVAIDLRRPNRSRRTRERLLVAIVTMLALIAVGGFLAGPLLLRHVAEQRLGRLLGRTVTIERVEVNPFTLSVTAERLSIREANGSTPFLTIRRLYVNAELASIPRRALIVREVRVESPRLRVERLQTAAGALGAAPAYNFSDLMARVTALSMAAPTSGGALPRFSINNIQVLDGALVLNDAPLRRRHEITGFALGVPFISTLPTDIDTFVEPGMSGRVDGTPFAIRGQTKPFKDTLQTVVELRLGAVDLRPYLPYVALPLNAAVSSAQMTAAVDISFAKPRGEAPLMSLRGNVVLGNVSLREPGDGGRTLFELRNLTVTLADCDLLARHFFLDEVSVSGLDVNLRRAANGRLSLAGFVAETARGLAAGGAQGRFSVREIRVEDSTLRFRDEGVLPPFAANVEDISLSIDRLSNAPGAEATMTAALRVSPGGRASLTGRFRLDPLVSSGTISIDGLELRRFAAYYRGAVPFELAGGRVRLRARYAFVDKPGHLSLHLRDGSGELKDLALRRPGARNEFLRVPELGVRGADVDFDGQAVSFADISVRDGRVRIEKDELLRWGAFHASELKVSTSPASVAIHDVSLMDFGANLIRFPDGHLNVEDAFGGLRPGPSKIESARPPPSISIGQVDLENGKVRFTDRSLRPSFSTQLTALAGRATNISSIPNTRAAVDLHGRLGPAGRVAVAGTFNVLEESPSLDLKGEAKDLALPPASPYAAKYLGYGIATGTLSLKGTYHVARQKLDAHNRVVLKQLSLGEKVPSPDAVSLPVKVALALLEDRDGVIDVDVPLSGALDDPHFELSGLIWQALGRKVVKATEAPFPLIAKAFGGGAELSHVAFPAGMATLGDGERAKLESLAKALNARPELAFQLQGGADPQQDREGLRRDRVERKLATDADIGDEDLRALARRRASIVRESLARLAPTGASRLFVVEPRLRSGATRVDVMLKTD